MSGVELRAVSKSFGSTRVLWDVDLSVPDGSLTAILGESGSGKTTLLRLIAGFERVDAGEICIGGRTVDDSRRSVHAQQRGVGYVPQEGALFPHLTVNGNVAFGLPRRERSRAAALIELIGLGGLGQRYPHQLSGGQQQRVALARALAIRPALVLLDEPFSSLDASLRASVRRDVAYILAETGTTALLVTHDQDEALALADQIAVLRDGRVAAAGSPRQLYQDPPDPAAAAYIGEANLLHAQVHGGMATTALGTLPLREEEAPAPDGPGRVLLRPEHLELSSDPAAGVAAVVDEVQYHGHDAMVTVTLATPAGESLLVRVAGEATPAPGAPVWVKAVTAARAWSDGATRHDANQQV
jgi:iron(III) transport system ATP-binding protein